MLSKLSSKMYIFLTNSFSKLSTFFSNRLMCYRPSTINSCVQVGTDARNQIQLMSDATFLFNIKWNIANVHFFNIKCKKEIQKLICSTITCVRPCVDTHVALSAYIM